MLSSELAKKISPEFLPTSRESYLWDILTLLETETGIAELVNDPVKMETFESWLKGILRRKYAHIAVPLPEDADRYAFLFDRCTKIMDARGSVLPDLMEWFVDYFCMWDFYTFVAGVFALFPYLEPRIVLERQRQFSNTVIRAMFRESISEQMWQGISELFFVWLKEFNKGESIPEKLNYYAKGIVLLQRILSDIIKWVIGSWDDRLGKMPPMLRFLICLHQKNLVLEAKHLKDPEVKQKIKSTIPEDVFIMVHLSCDSDCLDILKETVMLLNADEDNAASSIVPQLAIPDS